MKNSVIRRADILLPAASVDMEKWAVVAVDQYTSEPEYWQAVEKNVGDAPSALRLVLPEIYLGESVERTSQMQAAMRRYLQSGILEEKLHSGYALIERETAAGSRLGLIACLDLEEYDYTAGSQSLIRATEGTVLERVPPRVAIRRGAALELPHVLMLLDDPRQSCIEAAYARRERFEPLYDFELMQGGGRLRGWKLDEESALALENALDEVYADCGGLFLAVGDGNHSLAAARACWLELKSHLTAEEQEGHPARFALVEIENLHSPAIVFEPIHRLVTGIAPEKMLGAFEEYLHNSGMEIRNGASLKIIGEGIAQNYGFDEYPLRCLQAFLDQYLSAHPEAKIDYIHGDDALRRLSSRPDALGFMPCAFEKSALFPFIRRWGVLPRKTFSMGNANEKRFYCEARKIEK